MAQSGLHGVVGLAVVRSIAGRLPGRSSSAAGKDGISNSRVKEFRRGITFGFVLGNILPDADLLPLAITFLFDSRLAMRMHRTATHSLVVIILLTLMGWLLAKGRGKAVALGLGIGAISHSVLDIFLWFSPVDLLWPLGIWGIPSEVNLWAGVETGRFVGNFLGALDYLAFAFYYVLLARIARRRETNMEFLPRLNLFTGLNVAFFAVYTVLSFVLSKGLFEIAHYAMFVLAFFPIAVYTTVKMRDTIEALL
jgi:membrane-bound metal-dependent hydrolase YbcI (DUF457 family)